MGLSVINGIRGAESGIQFYRDWGFSMIEMDDVIL